MKRKKQQKMKIDTERIKNTKSKIKLYNCYTLTTKLGLIVILDFQDTLLLAKRPEW